MYKELIAHVKSVLPLFTDKFTRNKPVTTVTRLRGDIQVTCVGHGLSVGQQFLLAGVKTQVEITNLTSDGTFVTATTTEDHHLVEKWFVEIESPEADFAGEKQVYDIIDGNTFRYLLGDISPTPPDNTGSLLTFDNLDFNGVHEVKSVIDTDNITYETLQTNLNNGSGSNMRLVIEDTINVTNNVRIYGGVSLDRIVQAYEENTGGDGPDRLCGFIIYEGGEVDDDRRIDSNAKNEATDFQASKYRMINNFSFYIFIPNKLDKSGIDSINLAFDLIQPINKTLVKYKPESMFETFRTTEQQVLTPTVFELIDYNLRYTIYRYGFQNINLLTNCNPLSFTGTFMGNYGDMYNPIDTVPFKQMNWTFLTETDETAKNDVYDIPQGTV